MLTRRGLIGSGLAFLGSFLLPRKVKKPEGQLECGDIVRVDGLRCGFHNGDDPFDGVVVSAQERRDISKPTYMAYTLIGVEHWPGPRVRRLRYPKSYGYVSFRNGKWRDGTQYDSSVTVTVIGKA